MEAFVFLRFCVVSLFSLDVLPLAQAADESCKTWSDCMKNGKKCDGIQDVSCICKNGQCKISSGCGTMGAFFFTKCSDCTEEDCEDEGACKWQDGSSCLWTGKMPRQDGGECEG
eukprot:TRINITY_DN15783_c0_g1_i1.p3 TRINITY_DN15783_c0_g1~~TRINITY_DN15783_c0_g1_i1.p3  ORF type:complete len:114 (-),score=25.60 TRINITY_DN15783_c0_g1_i1:402-743(-)